MARSSTVHCQSELQGIVENRSLLAGGVVFDILRCWKDDKLQMSEYSQLGKYKGEVTNTTENDVYTKPRHKVYRISKKLRALTFLCQGAF